MSPEQRHEIYDNDGTLIGYESAQADPATGQFNRYDEANTLCGYAKDSGDVIYHYDKAMRFIGFARLEDGVLREYDRQSNVVGYQVRQLSDTEDAVSPVQGYVDYAQPANGPASGASIYAAPKTYAFSNNNWLGNRFADNDDDSVDVDGDGAAADVDAADNVGEADSTFGSPPTSFDYQSTRNHPADYAAAAPNSASSSAFRNNSHYNDNIAEEAPGSPFERHSMDDAQPDGDLGRVNPYARSPKATPDESPDYDNSYNTWQAERTASNSTGYAMRGEIVDDVDEFGNEIDPNHDKPFWENMPPGATNPPPMAKPSPFASKPSLLQRLLARVMPFFSNKKAPPSAPARSSAAALPAPERSSESYATARSAYAQPAEGDYDATTEQRWQAQPGDARSAPPNPAQYNAPPQRNEEVVDEDENFDPFAEFRIVLQKVRYYTDRFFPKRRATSQRGNDSLDSRDAVLDQMDRQQDRFDPVDRADVEPGFGNNVFGAGQTSASQSAHARTAGFGAPDMLAYLATLPSHLQQVPQLLLAGTVKAIQTPLWLWWMTATTLGAIAFGMLRLFIPPVSDIPAGVYGGVYGLTMGLSQWAMLRHRYRTTWPWVLLSVCASVAGTLLWTGEQSWLQAHGNAAGLGEMILLSCIISTAQWLLLRNLSSRATYWLLLSPIAGVVGWIGYQIGSLAGYMGALTAHGLLLGAVSGLGLVHTLEDTSRSGLLKTPRNSSIITAFTMVSNGIRAISAAIALGGLLEAISGNFGSAMHGLPTQQTPLLLALLSVYPARLFVSLTSMGSALGYKQNEAGPSRAWLVGASIASIIIEIVAQIILPPTARPAGSGWFIVSSLMVLVLIDVLTPLPAAEEAPLRTTLTSLSAIGLLSAGLLIFFASVFTAVHAVNVDLAATASLTADAVGFSLSLGAIISIVRVLLSALAIFVALRLPGERSNGWAEVPMGVLAIAVATFGPMLIDTSATGAAGSADQQWLAPILLCGSVLAFGILRNAPAFGGVLPKASPDAEHAKRSAPRLVPVALIIGILSLGVVLSRNGVLTNLAKDPRFGSLVSKVQSMGSGVTSQVSQIKLPKSMNEVQQSTAGLQQTVSDLLQKIQPTPEPTADWPPAPQKSK